MGKKQKTGFVYTMAKIGALSIGIVYCMVGTIAILSLLRLRQGGADESSIMAILANIPFGEVFIAALFFGLLAYIIWKFYNALKDPYGYGKNWKGAGKRIGIAGGGLAYGMIAYSAIQAFLGMALSSRGNPKETQLMVAKIFNWWAGEWLIAIFGLMVALTGIAQFIYVIKKSYLEKLEVKNISKRKKHVLTVLAWFGHFARGTILLIIAWFMIKASMKSNSSEVVNTDKAFNFLGEHLGHLPFVLVAVGTIFYGFYMFGLSLYYDFQDDFK